METDFVDFIPQFVASSSSDAERVANLLGLSDSSIQRTNGELGAEMLESTLEKLCNPKTSACIRYFISKRVKDWILVTPLIACEKSLLGSSLQFLQAIVDIIRFPDETGASPGSTQLPALYLAFTFQFCIKKIDLLRNDVFVQQSVVKALDRVFSILDNSAETNNNEAKLVCTETTRYLVLSISPLKGNYLVRLFE
jgi:hypothetical protein